MPHLEDILTGTHVIGDLPATKLGYIYEVMSTGADSPRRTWGAGNSRVAINARVLYRDAGGWCTDMVGSVVRDESAGPGNVVLDRLAPEKVPNMPVIPFPATLPQLYCVLADEIESGGNEVIIGGKVTPLGPGNDSPHRWPHPRWCKFRCVFEFLPYIVMGGKPASTTPELFRYCTRQRRGRPREVRIPGGGWIPIGSTQPIPHTEHVVVPFADLDYGFIRWPYEAVPRVRLQDREGTINNGIFDGFHPINNPRGWTWPAGTLLMKGYDEGEPYGDAAGAAVVDWHIHFEYNPHGWNFYPTKTAQGGAASLGWTEVSDTGSAGGRRPYETSNFDLMCIPE